MSFLELLSSIFGPEVEDAEEETFLLFSQPAPPSPSDLGFVNRTAPSVTVPVGSVEYTIHQSPAVLSSDRAGGTTGAVVWRISPVFADWLAGPTNFLFTAAAAAAAEPPQRRLPILDGESAVLELGCGVSPLNALALGPRVGSYTLTDQSYVGRLVRRNLEENVRSSSPPPPQKTAKARRRQQQQRSVDSDGHNISFAVLDWETDLPPPPPPISQRQRQQREKRRRGYDVVLACDCVYNHALVPPLVQTLVEACRLRCGDDDDGDDDGDDEEEVRLPTVCLVAQQLRHHDVVRAWLAGWLAAGFAVWRVPDGLVPGALRPEEGFVVHIGVLRE